MSRVDRAILLTGTPLENRVGEFRNLVSYLRPDLADGAEDLSPRAFRRQIAPAYLRRNQEDVLTELPELIEVEEWLPMSAEDAADYRAAVRRGNFMEMRQAAMLRGARSEKVGRLIEIVREAEENERRVIVFSYFRDVLDLVARSLPGPVFGPLTGSVPANKRQDMVDRFSAAEHGAVLVAQIQAGGVGLNIQSASVVVICEPQLKPTTEAQAVARAHRMGQVQSVQVHRLLSEDSVDQRIVELLAEKKRLFDEFARVSDMAGSTPEAVDLSEADLVREVVAAERERLAKSAATQA
jgi:SNF2 family DNA or RNA helicase